MLPQIIMYNEHFLQIVQFYAQGNTKSATTAIFRISGGKIKAGDNALYHDIIHIPPLPPSRLDGCRLVDIDYVITVGYHICIMTTHKKMDQGCSRYNLGWLMEVFSLFWWGKVWLKTHSHPIFVRQGIFSLYIKVPSRGMLLSKRHASIKYLNFFSQKNY